MPRPARPRLRPPFPPPQGARPRGSLTARSRIPPVAVALERRLWGGPPGPGISPAWSFRVPTGPLTRSPLPTTRTVLPKRKSPPRPPMPRGAPLPPPPAHPATNSSPIGWLLAGSACPKGETEAQQLERAPCPLQPAAPGVFPQQIPPERETGLLSRHPPPNPSQNGENPGRGAALSGPMPAPAQRAEGVQLG